MIFFHKNFFLCLFLCLIQIYTYAQNIEGRVLEKNTDDLIEPIVGANVYWENSSIGTVTDKNGFYSIQEAPSFPATLLVSFIGYEVADMVLIDEEYIFYMSPNLELQEKFGQKPFEISITPNKNGPYGCASMHKHQE